MSLNVLVVDPDKDRVDLLRKQISTQEALKKFNFNFCCNGDEVFNDIFESRCDFLIIDSSTRHKIHKDLYSPERHMSIGVKTIVEVALENDNGLSIAICSTTKPNKEEKKFSEQVFFTEEKASCHTVANLLQIALARNITSKV